jgi:hypothetical protein
VDLTYSTYLGGKNSDYCFGIATDEWGNAYVTGRTASSTSFPKVDPLQTTLKGSCDAFVAMFNAVGQFVYCTHLGGVSVDAGHAIAVDSKYNVYVAGETSSPDFPTKVPLQKTKGAGFDAFVLKIAPKISQKGLMAFYSFDGDAQDVSGNSRHGEVHRVKRVKGFEGEAYYFQGTGPPSFIKAPVYLNPDEYPQLTMGAWVRVPRSALARPRIRQLISHDNGGFDRSLGLDNRTGAYGWSAFAGQNGVLGPLAITPDRWVFVAVVYDQWKGTVRLHVDDKSIQGPGTLGKGLDFIHIGANPTYGEYFQGYMDNVFIFDWALNLKEIEYIRQQGAAGVLSLRRP